MATKSDIIKKIHHNLQIQNVCSYYSLSFQEICTVGAFTCAHHMIAITVAYNQLITSVYQFINDCVDEPYYNLAKESRDKASNIHTLDRSAYLK